MVSRPTERFFRNPCPTGVGIDPAAICVGTPGTRLFGLVRLPNIAVGGRLAPNAQQLKPGVERGIRGGRRRLVKIAYAERDRSLRLRCVRCARFLC